LAGDGPEFRRLLCPTERACGRGSSVLARGQATVPHVRVLCRRYDPCGDPGIPPQPG